MIVRRLSSNGNRSWTSGEMSVVVQSNVCPECDAMPGQECTGRFGTLNSLHMARWDVADGSHPGVVIIEEEPW